MSPILPRYDVEVLDPVVQDYSLRMLPGQYTVLGMLLVLENPQC